MQNTKERGDKSVTDKYLILGAFVLIGGITFSSSGWMLHLNI